jgi:shikimate kinase
MTADHANIYLVGPMGVGKSVVGRQLADCTSRTFYDSDAEIIKRTGVEIDRVFEIEGETGFRRRETRVIEELTALQNVILATGGGGLLEARNRDCLGSTGTVVYLRASPEVLARRTAYDRKRPLLQTGNRLARIVELLAEREPHYLELARLIVDTDHSSVRRTVDEICRGLGLSCRQ